jgi:DNA gyrase inhibitor GyrI
MDFINFQLSDIGYVVVALVGHPMRLQDACNQLNQYIMERRLQPITVGYNVTKKTDMLSPENTEIDVYVGISPNIL